MRGFLGIFVTHSTAMDRWEFQLEWIDIRSAYIHVVCTSRMETPEATKHGVCLLVVKIFLTADFVVQSAIHMMVLDLVSLVPLNKM